MAIPPMNENDIPRCVSVRRADRVEALRHREGLAIRAALKDVLIGAGL